MAALLDQQCAQLNKVKERNVRSICRQQLFRFFVFTFLDFYIWIVASNMGCENFVFLEIDPFLFYLAAHN